MRGQPIFPSLSRPAPSPYHSLPTLCEMRRRLLISLFSWAPVGVLVSDKFFTLHYDEAGALSPSIAPRSLLLVSRLHAPHAAARGDPVLVDDLAGSARLLRRVIALQGDYVRPPHARDPPAIVPKGHVWLDGGDAPHQRPVPAALVKGTVIAVLNPARRVEREPSDRVVQPAVRYS